MTAGEKVLMTIAFLWRNGYSPSIREIAETMGKGTTTIHYHLKRLKRNGFISYKNHRPRTIHITRAGLGLLEKLQPEGFLWRLVESRPGGRETYAGHGPTWPGRTPGRSGKDYRTTKTPESDPLLQSGSSNVSSREIRTERDHQQTFSPNNALGDARVVNGVVVRVMSDWVIVPRKDFEEWFGKN
ncbi:MAG: hypothetical protein DSY80_07750 [Desulfocapsa sp.]|nr:MAG: hypothetical protein DSY80_07750 [Desulfocapsa sp.]